ncbi:MAG: hypothetical protein ACRD2N_19215 [Vicinamibacterales bacterium]
MPPRYAYWTIIVEDQPTAFRSAAVEELMPTFNRLKSKQPSAVLKWFQNGKLWDSELDAREAIRRQREPKRRKTGGPSRSSHRPPLEWKPKTDDRTARPKLEWKPREGPIIGKPARRAGAHGRPSSGSRDSNWRPGGEHRDPRQKYKDAKKAKWTRFKEAIRQRRPARKP